MRAKEFNIKIKYLTFICKAICDKNNTENDSNTGNCKIFTDFSNKDDEQKEYTGDFYFSDEMYFKSDWKSDFYEGELTEEQKDYLKQEHYLFIKGLGIDITAEMNSKDIKGIGTYFIEKDHSYWFNEKADRLDNGKNCKHKEANLDIFKTKK